jgi:hypothetical protein
MRSLRVSRTLAAGLVGIVLGGLAETIINRLAGTAVISDGLTWGAILGILAASLPGFSRMGSLVVKSDKPLVDFTVGVLVFLLISAAIIVFFYGVFGVFVRLLA